MKAVLDSYKREESENNFLLYLLKKNEAATNLLI